MTPSRLTPGPSDNGHGHDEPPVEISPIVPGRVGRPSFSLEALRERIERQFQEETADRPDILIELDSEEKRRALLAEVADYVLAVEAISLTVQDRATVLDKAYRNLFTLGPLEAYAQDETVTEITVNGPREIHVRRGMERLHKVEAAFDDRQHLAGLIERVLATMGIALAGAGPFVEAGVRLAGRPARLSLVMPPVSAEYSLEIRLHPRQPVTLDDLHARLNVLTPQAATLLRSILAGGWGLLVVGDVGLGKTTLAGALANALPPGAGLVAVERAAELGLPPGTARRAPVPPNTRFEDEIRAALDEAPGWLVVDEIRGDESAAVWEALTRPDPPRYLWVFRGSPQPDRLRSALGMVIRKQHPALEQAAIYRALAERLPFVVTLGLAGDAARVELIAEWVLEEAGAETALRLCPLLTVQGEAGLTAAGRPRRALDLPGDFWG